MWLAHAENNFVHTAFVHVFRKTLKLVISRCDFAENGEVQQPAQSASSSLRDPSGNEWGEAGRKRLSCTSDEGAVPAGKNLKGGDGNVLKYCTSNFV